MEARLWRTGGLFASKENPPAATGGSRSMSPSAVLEHGPPLEPRNGRVTDSIRPADIGQRLAGLAACNGFLNLEWTELWLASEPDAPCLRSFPPLRCSGQDHRSFEFRQGSEHGQDQLAVWAGRVDHRISNRLEWRLLVPAFGLRPLCADAGPMGFEPSPACAGTINSLSSVG